MKVGDKVKVIDPDYAEFIGDNIGTIVSEYIPCSQFGFLSSIQMWNVQFEDPALNYHFMESYLERIV